MDKDDYNGLWEKQVGKVNAFKDDEIDAFFRYFLKAKYTKSRKEGQRFDGGYHREMFKQDMVAQLNLEHDPGSVKKFIKDTLRYYTDLYAKIWSLSKLQNSNAPSVFYNSLNEMDGQFLLILSACELDDEQETEKIKMISFELDRLFTLLQLQNSYDSNEFATRLSLISNEIREQSVDVVRTVFDKHLIEILSDRRAAKVDQPFSYTYFKNASIEHLNKRFVRYFFARVDQFIADVTSVKMRHPLSDLVSKSGAKTGFHVEHILSRNAENQALFNNDEERFEQERNRLGGILLLKGRDNISSNNEVYTQKLKSYATTLYWNETLRPDTYKSKLDLKAFMEKHNLDFHHLDSFGADELEYRQKLLFDMASLIWA